MTRNRQNGEIQIAGFAGPPNFAPTRLIIFLLHADWLAEINKIPDSKYWPIRWWKIEMITRVGANPAILISDLIHLTFHDKRIIRYSFFIDLFRHFKALTVQFSTIIKILELTIILLHWQILMTRLLPLVIGLDPVTLKPKFSTLRRTFGRKLLSILIIPSKFDPYPWIMDKKFMNVADWGFNFIKFSKP